MLKILHVITSMRTGGAERLVSQMLPRMRQAGHEVSLALFDGTDTPFLREISGYNPILSCNDPSSTPSLSGNNQNDPSSTPVLPGAGITTHILGMGYRSMYDPRNIIKLQRLMRRGYDIVHTHNTTPQLFTAMAHRPKGTHLITTEHNTSNRRRNHSLLRPVDRWMYDRYERIICCSDPVEAALHVAINDPSISQRITTIPNGIDLSHYSGQPHAMDSDHVNILMVAAFREQKDHITPLKALTLLPETITLTYAGDGVTRPQAEREASALGVAGRVRFLGNVSDIPALYREADIALLSSHHEGLSLSVIEAMASGTPLIVSDVPGVREIVGDGALRFPFADHVTLADRIRSLMHDRELYSTTALHGIDRARAYDIDATVAAYLELYQNQSHN